MLTTRFNLQIFYEVIQNNTEHQCNKKVDYKTGYNTFLVD